MKPSLDENQPLFLQIAQIILNEIVEGHIKEGEQLPSENELSSFYTINRATVRKGLQTLVDDAFIYKQRGIGMFVSEGAYQKIVEERQKQFRQNYITPLLEEGARLGMDVQKIIQLIEKEAQS
ncbi:GntR family transcriptional regulator [Sporosarcina thermotolerans]|uniref:GntR family transcriptional regulator n=1 Tax=Sporosarcina thermotolerans TaxID=633404 RepID=A0AAW9AD17_9BACL|nr:GntR family transcriptional regulator [Sporosarcina thermotolerans]MDW0117516.1 GntR family transcriptional regulator [Sporosarcina thermotolerans]